MIYIYISIGITLFLFFLAFSFISLKEKEPQALKRSLFVAFTIPLPFFAFAFIPPASVSFIGIFTLWLLFLIAFISLVPFKGELLPHKEKPTSRFDERDTMFSRNEIIRHPKLQHEYYARNHEKLIADAEWQVKPGLMSEQSSMYSPMTFTAADASFFQIEQLRPFVDGDINPIKKEFSPEKLSIFIKNWAKKLGAVSVGICEMQDYHYYSVRGRGPSYNKEVQPKYKYGIALTIEMDKEFLATGPAGPTLMESSLQYLNSGLIALQIAKFIRELGFESRAHIDGNYEVICPLVARDAGLGEIGRMGLLMTPELGPRVRIAVVTTNIPLSITQRKPDYTIHHFCSICKKCAHACPSQAIPNSKLEEAKGVHKWQLNHEKCFSYWCTTGTDCGRCMSVCPYSHPNNLMHNMIRLGIKNNKIFRHFALFMDDFFYGHKPKPAKIPKWMDLK